MKDQKETPTTKISVKWVKGTSGRTYLCPVEALERLERATDSDLERICFDESVRPRTA